MHYHFRYLLISLFSLLITQIYSDQSATGSNTVYREVCQKAADEPSTFQNFRAINDYTDAVEMRCEDGDRFAEYVLKEASQEVFGKTQLFKKLDLLGSPRTAYYPGLGNFSATTLRYIVIADHIKKLFTMPKNATIVEIGAGFGGQCYILSVLGAFSKYYIYDLPEVEALIEKVMKHLNVQNVTYLPPKALFPEQHIDLLISNYAYSECDWEAQMSYFKRMFRRADRGYIIYNQLARSIHGLDSLLPEELMEMLKKNNMNPKIHEELIPTYEGNVLIVWDRTNSIE